MELGVLRLGIFEYGVLESGVVKLGVLELGVLESGVPEFDVLESCNPGDIMPDVAALMWPFSDLILTWNATFITRLHTFVIFALLSCRCNTSTRSISMQVYTFFM